MAALGMLVHLGKQTLRSPKLCTGLNVTSADFLVVQIPLHVVVHDWDP